MDGIPEYVKMWLSHEGHTPEKKGAAGRRKAVVLGAAVVALVRLFLPLTTTEYEAYKYASALLYAAGALPTHDPKALKARYKGLTRHGG